MIKRLIGWMLLLTWPFHFNLYHGRANLAFQTSEDVVYIFTPQSGQAVQGIIPVEVSLIVSRLEVATLEFRYASHPTDTWFLLAQVTENIPDGVVAEWDTTTITDGEYELRLTAVTVNQQRLEFLVQDLRVRNYSAVETETPTPFVPTETLLPGQLPVTPTYTRTSLPPTVTPQPTNPGILTMNQFTQSSSIAVLITLALFLILGIYVFIRSSLLGRI